jgi:protein-S-isoprenylcysteine O-methyltransferase Ste14
MSDKAILPPTYVFLALVAIAGLHLLAPVTTIISWPWRLVGIVPLGAGIVLNLIADRAFKTTGTTVKPFQESSALVTGGVFRLSRHPMYLGIVLIILGIACLLGSLTPFVVVPLLGFLLDRRFIRVEERMLEETFGAAWLEYKARVRRWI